MASIGFGLASGAASSIGGAIGGTAGALVGGALQTGIGAAFSAIFGAGRRDPSVAFNYSVEIDGLTLGMFTGVEGMKVSVRVDEVNQIGVNDQQKYLIGPAKFEPLTLKRGFVAGDGLLFDMMKSTYTETIPTMRKMVHVVALKRGSNSGIGGALGMNEIGRISFYNAFVSAWSGPNFSTQSNEVAVESITIHYERFEFHPGGLLDQVLGAAAGAAMGMIGGAISGNMPKISVPGI
jgi:phage tail-like protein